MKLISEHLGEIIVAIAGIALLVAAVCAFSPEISDFFKSIVDTLTSKGSALLDSIEIPSVTVA